MKQVKGALVYPAVVIRGHPIMFLVFVIPHFAMFDDSVLNCLPTHLDQPSEF